MVLQYIYFSCTQQLPRKENQSSSTWEFASNVRAQTCSPPQPRLQCASGVSLQREGSSCSPIPSFPVQSHLVSVPPHPHQYQYQVSPTDLYLPLSARPTTAQYRPPRSGTDPYRYFSHAPRLLIDPLFSIFLSIPVSSLICSLQESSSSSVLFSVPTCTEFFPTVPSLLFLLRFCTPSLSLQSNTSLSFPPSLYFIPYTSPLQTTSTGVYWISTTILGPHS